MNVDVWSKTILPIAKSNRIVFIQIFFFHKHWAYHYKNSQQVQQKHWPSFKYEKVKFCLVLDFLLLETNICIFFVRYLFWYVSNYMRVLSKEPFIDPSWSVITDSRNFPMIVLFMAIKIQLLLFPFLLLLPLLHIPPLSPPVLLLCLFTHVLNKFGPMACN